MSSHSLLETRPTPVVVAKLAFKPFDIYVKDILDRFQFHQNVVRDELLFAKMGTLRSAYDAEALRNDAARKEAEAEADRNRTRNHRIWDSLEGQGKCEKPTFRAHVFAS